MTAKQLRPTLTCLGAFAAGCFLVSDVFGQDANTQTNVPVSNMERLFTDKDEWSMPASSPSVETDRLDLRPTTIAVQPALQSKKFVGPSISDFMGGVRDASMATKSATARVVVTQQSKVQGATWEAPALPQIYAPAPKLPTAVAMKKRFQPPTVKERTVPDTSVRKTSFQEPQFAQARNENNFTMPATPTSTGGYQNLTNSLGFTHGSFRQVEHVASLKHLPLARSYTGTHQVQNVSLQQFETKVVETWGRSLSATATEDGRFVNVELPTRVSGRMAMTIDRKTRTIKYAGDEELKDNWHRLIETLDSTPKMRNDGSVVQATLLDRGNAESRTIRQVAYLMGMTQDQEGLAELPLVGGDAAAAIAQIPQDQLSGKVKLIEDPDTGALTIVGDPKDIEIIKKVVESISSQASERQPSIKNIPLKNVQSEAVVEQIQSAYDAGFATANGSANLIPIASSNSILVTAQPDGIKAIEKIIAGLDISEDPSAEGDFKALRLKYISAADARDRLQTYFSQANLPGGDNTLPSAPVNVIADYRSNTVIVKGSAQNIKQAEAFLETIDVADSGAANSVRIFPLRNTLAEEMAIVLQDAINGQQPNAGSGYNPNQDSQNQNSQNNTQIDPNRSQLRGAGLTLKTIAENGEEVVGAIMFDVRVTADRNSNSLVVTGPEQSMALVAELITQLDRIPDAETQIKVFEIVNGDAQALLDMLEALFGSDQNANNGTNTALSQLPLQGTGGDGQTLVNLRFSIDPRTNTIIASGPAADLQTVEDLLNRLDVADVNKSETLVYRLSNAPALDISEALTTWLETRSDIIETDPRTNNDQGQARRAINVVPEIVSNSLIVTARPEYRAEIEGIIKALDRRPPMVHVKVLIAEVDLSTLEEFGVELGVQDSLLFDRGTVVDAAGAITGGIGFPFNVGASANSNARLPETVAGQALSNLGVGRVNSDLGYGGLVLSGGNESVNVLIRALKDRQCVRVLSKPQIMTIENLQGRVSIGAEVPRVAGTTQSNFGVTQDIQFVDVGVILEVTPRVSPDGLIVMAVNAKRSSVGGDESAITIGFSDGSPILAPQIIETEANTTLMARSGQTVVFSGLISERKSHGERGAPILSDLPLIGPLFKYETDEATRSELLIIMTPTLVTDEQDIAMVNQDATERMHWCECDVAEIYGSSIQTRHMSTPGEAMETYRPVADPMGGRPVMVDSEFGVPLSQQERATDAKREGIRRASYSNDDLDRDSGVNSKR